MKARHRRHWSKTSPLDKLGHGVGAELATRCRSTTPFREIRAWLAAAHGVKTSINALSEWWQRQEEQAGDGSAVAQAECASVLVIGGFEIRIHAPGAREVRVELVPVAPAVSSSPALRDERTGTALATPRKTSPARAPKAPGRRAGKTPKSR